MKYVTYMRAMVISSIVLGMTACTQSPPQRPDQPDVPKNPEVQDISDPEVFADTLEIPWGIAFLPGGDMLATERPGILLRISDGDRTEHIITGVHHRGEGGLLGVVLHPNFSVNHFVYLYLTALEDGRITNRVERYRLEDDQLTDRFVIIDSIPGAQYHDGGRIAFGPDGYLYITTGDAGTEMNAQDTDSLAGKILRVRDDGSIPEDNPFGNAVYSYGHRNPQGLTWDDQGVLWSTEHGRSGVRSGFDELNRIEKGGNFGWPIIQGDLTDEHMISPVLHSGPSTTWAPASAAYIDGRIFFGGLRGETLYAVTIDTEDPVLEEYFTHTYGRLRDVHLGPDGLLYFTTSNRDGRGNPEANDDRIMRVDPALLL